MNNQMDNNQTHPKFYLRANEDLVDLNIWNSNRERLSASGCTLEELTVAFRSFYREVYPLLFSHVVKQVWLEQQLMFNGKRRIFYRANGLTIDRAFGQYIKVAVGMSHKPITATAYFGPVSSYLPDFFPEFLWHNPFKSPEKYEYPYEHVSIDFLTFVHQVDNRLDLLAEAERKKMSYAEFTSWAYDQTVWINQESKRDKYALTIGHRGFTYIQSRDVKWGKKRRELKFNIKK